MTAKPKARSHRITAQAVATFREERATAGTYAACTAGGNCAAPGARAHCEACTWPLDARRTLHTELGLRPWPPDPLDCDADDPPPPAGQVWPSAWRQVRSLRLDRKRAAGGS